MLWLKILLFVLMIFLNFLFWLIYHIPVTCTSNLIISYPALLGQSPLFYFIGRTLLCLNRKQTVMGNVLNIKAYRYSCLNQTSKLKKTNKKHLLSCIWKYNQKPDSCFCICMWFRRQRRTKARPAGQSIILTSSGPWLLWVTQDFFNLLLPKKNHFFSTSVKSMRKGLIATLNRFYQKHFIQTFNLIIFHINILICISSYQYFRIIMLV